MVLVVGDINLDITAPLSAHPAVGGDCLSEKLFFQCGGVGLNAAMALARLNAPVRLVSCVGKDWFGDFLLERLAHEGIDTSHVQRSPAMTGLIFITVSPDGQRTFFGSRGANAELALDSGTCECLEGVAAVQIAGFAFLAPGSSRFADDLIAAAKARGLWVTLDVGDAPGRDMSEKLMRVAGQVDTVFANHKEASALTGEPSLEQAFHDLERAGAREVVLKLGADGCLIRHEGTLCRVPALRVQVVDTTGAGDAFTAGFMAARLWGWPGKQCALFANACGAAATTVMGAGERLPAIAAIEELLDKTRFDASWVGVRGDICSRLKARAGASADNRGA